MAKRLILASSSPYRSAQLAQLGLDFDTFSPNIDESPGPHEQAEALAERLSLEKARAVSAQLSKPALIIGSDQVAECQGALLGKPGSPERARQQLAQCSAQVVTFHTALTVIDSAGDRFITRSIPTRVVFRPLSEKQIKSYVEREDVLDCAGSFKCEGLGIALFKSVESEDPSALIGLPLIALTSILAEFGLFVL